VDSEEWERASLTSKGTLMHSTGMRRMFVEGVEGEGKRERGESGGSWLSELMVPLQKRRKRAERGKERRR
jgi:hypothetical protein